MATLIGLLLLLWTTGSAYAFCGFYVAKADASLYNEASQVVVVRNEEKTVLSMMNDYKGELKEFALVVPVPVVLQKDQIHIGEKALFDRIDAYSSPRLVEYFDENPCERRVYEKMMLRDQGAGVPKGVSASREKALGVSIEAQYTIGEYDIVILSAKQSDGLETWLTESGYKIPKGASRALKPYILQDMKFFVAKVNLKEQAKTGLAYLRPIQFAFDSKKFMLPIRLGMINSKGAQDLLIYVLTKEGRVETTNYRTVKLPSGMDIPPYVKDDFAHFYKAMFAEQVKREAGKAVFTEYFWNMGWCDPCAADPLSPDELRKLGVFWVENGPPVLPQRQSGRKWWPGPRPIPVPSGPLQVMVTRLHVRYSPDTFPEDLMFQETKDQENFQGRYVLRHPWEGNPNSCPEAKEYLATLPRRQDQEAQTLATLTGWNIQEIRKKTGVPAAKPQQWWENLWK